MRHGLKDQGEICWLPPVVVAIVSVAAIGRVIVMASPIRRCRRGIVATTSVVMAIPDEWCVDYSWGGRYVPGARSAVIGGHRDWRRIGGLGWRCCRYTPEVTGGGADKSAFGRAMMIVVADDCTGDAPDQYIVRDLRAEDLSLSRHGEACGTQERKH